MQIEKIMDIALLVTLAASFVVIGFSFFSEELWPAPKVVAALLGLCGLLVFCTLLAVLIVFSRLKK